MIAWLILGRPPITTVSVAPGLVIAVEGAVDVESTARSTTLGFEAERGVEARTKGDVAQGEEIVE